MICRTRILKGENTEADTRNRSILWMRLMWPRILQFGAIIFMYSFQFQHIVTSQKFGPPFSNVLLSVKCVLLSVSTDLINATNWQVISCSNSSSVCSVSDLDRQSIKSYRFSSSSTASSHLSQTFSLLTKRPNIIVL